MAPSLSNLEYSLSTALDPEFPSLQWIRCGRIKIGGLSQLLQYYHSHNFIPPLSTTLHCDRTHDLVVSVYDFDTWDSWFDSCLGHINTLWRRIIRIFSGFRWFLRMCVKPKQTNRKTNKWNQVKMLHLYSVAVKVRRKTCHIWFHIDHIVHVGISRVQSF